MSKNKNSIHRVRYEDFGGIISSIDPPYLAWVDQSFMKNISYSHSKLWTNKNRNYLSAPTEIHFSVTNKCNQNCDGCYMNSLSNYESDLPLNDIKKILKTFRDMGVFHVALGGGEAFEREDFGEIVKYCKEIDLIPNLTTNGQYISKQDLEICRLMGQINISLDGINENYSINGRNGDFTKTDQSIKKLRNAGINVGINCIVSNKNYHHLEELVNYCSKQGLNEIEFLKYKPAGRGQTNYDEYCLTNDMIKKFYPRLLELQKNFIGELKIDCSFIPALVYHNPPVEDLEKLAVQGCDAGNILLGVKSNGNFSGCSFMENDENVSDLENL
jgi:MoaA/NifB/PqqE/SkfB family radical SAM enzyme